MSLLVSSHLARDLARLLASWVAAIVLVQAMASAVGAVQGPRHVHASAAAFSSLFVHATADAHAVDHHDHGGWARHVHTSPTPDPSLPDDAQDLGAAASLVLAAMVALGAVRSELRIAEAGHVLRASTAWSLITHAAPFPERPPRA